MTFCCAYAMPASPAESVTARIAAVLILLVMVVYSSNCRRRLGRPRSGLPQQHAEADDQARHVSVADVAPDQPFDDRLDQAGKYQNQSPKQKKAPFNWRIFWSG